MTMLLCGQLVLNPSSCNEEPSQIEQENPVDGAIVVFPEMVFVFLCHFLTNHLIASIWESWTMMVKVKLFLKIGKSWRVDEIK